MTTPIAVTGIAAVVDVREEARRLAVDAFTRSYSAPAIIFCPLSDRDAVEAPAEETKLETAPGRSGGASFYGDKVAFVVKREGNPFLSMITLGRAGNNDIVVRLPTVSKFHVFFDRDGGRWFVTAQHSVNGTTVDGNPLVPGARVELRDGSRIRLGDDLEGVFYLPGAFRSHLLTAG
jgi:hypothetical protein